MSERTIWRQMIERCNKPTSKAYKWYGARGITVDERWMSFDNFIADMGYRPTDKHTLERKDNNKGYSRQNCCWATRKEQARNRRSTKLTLDDAIEIVRMKKRGVLKRVIAEKYGIDKSLIMQIMRREKWAEAVELAQLEAVKTILDENEYQV